MFRKSIRFFQRSRITYPTAAIVKLSHIAVYPQYKKSCRIQTVLGIGAKEAMFNDVTAKQ
jgi:hypothetical protein